MNLKDIELNGFQSLSVVGLVFSVLVQLGLFAMDKHIQNIWALYPSWAAVFLLGTALRYFDHGSDDHHHHH